MDKADIQQAAREHDYDVLPITQIQVDECNKITESEAQVLETLTREQSKNKMWFQARKYRVTASRFGEVCKATSARNYYGLSSTIFNPPLLHTKAVTYGKANEIKAIKKFSDLTGKIVLPCGLFVNTDYPFLGATPDGIISSESHSLLEVKCPFSARDSMISPESVSFLEKSNETCNLKRNHNYYFQIQGQLGITKRKLCYFVVFTQIDIFVEEIVFDDAFFCKEIVPKLTEFYENHYRPFAASKF